MAGLDGSMVINVSNVWAGVAPKGTTKPTFTATGATSLASWDFDADTALGFSNIGHTSEETDVTLAPEREGGERLGSLQRSSLRRTRTTQTYTLSVAALQLDNDNLTLMFGGGDDSQEDYFGVGKTYEAPERSALVVLGDSAGFNAALWVPLAEVATDGELAFGPSAITEGTLQFAILDDDAAADLIGFFRAGLGTAA